MVSLSEIEKRVKGTDFLKSLFKEDELDPQVIFDELEFELDDELGSKNLDLEFSPKDFTIYFNPKFLETHDIEFVMDTLVHEFEHVVEALDGEERQFTEKGMWFNRPEEQRAMELQVEYMIDEGKSNEEIIQYFIKKFPAITEDKIKEFLSGI